MSLASGHPCGGSALFRTAVFSKIRWFSDWRLFEVQVVLEHAPAQRPVLPRNFPLSGHDSDPGSAGFHPGCFSKLLYFFGLASFRSSGGARTFLVPL